MGHYQKRQTCGGQELKDYVLTCSLAHNIRLSRGKQNKKSHPYFVATVNFMVKSWDMLDFPNTLVRIGYTRYEFGQIFQIYSRHVYTGLFRDFTFAEMGGRYFISFREEAGKIPLVTIEKRRLGPDRSLFIATTPGPAGRLIPLARSEKIESFVAQLTQAVDAVAATRGLRQYQSSTS